MKKLLLSLSIFLLPLLASAQPLDVHFAQNKAAGTQLGRIIFVLLDLLALVTFIVGALAMIWFFWGIIQYVLKADNEEKQREARNYMLYAVIGMFVMFSIWGLVNLIRNTFFWGGPLDPLLHLTPADIPKVPVLPTTP